MRAPIFRGTIKDGKIVLDNRDRFRDYLPHFEGKRIEMIVRERRPWRSEEQNRYYHGVIVAMLSEHLGYEKVEMHDILKQQFHINSTADLKTREFQEFCESVRMWAAKEFNMAIPDPNQVDY